MSDYISRVALVDRLNKNLSACNPGTFSEMCYADAIETVKHFPAADVEPVRHGVWRLVRRIAACGEYECSVCGRIETFGCFNKPENNPYCHCGAKMELEDENHVGR
mgnify:CR=1 FL=1